MIHLYNGGTKLAEYHTVGLPSSDFFASSNRWTMFHETLQPVPSIKGDGVPLIKEFTITFGLKADTATQAKLEIAEARAYLLQATSIYYAEGKMWRALWGDERNLKRRAFYPQEITDVDSPCKWGFTIEFRPKYSEPTSIQAETKEDYDDAVGGPTPVDCGRNFSTFNSQVEVDDYWSVIGDMTATFIEDTENYLRITPIGSGQEIGYLIPDCDTPLRADFNFSLDYSGVGITGYRSEIQIHLRGDPELGDFSQGIRINVAKLANNVYVFQTYDDGDLEQSVFTGPDDGERVTLFGSLVGDQLVATLKKNSDDSVFYTVTRTVTYLTEGISFLRFRFDDASATLPAFHLFNNSLAEYTS